MPKITDISPPPALAAATDALAKLASEAMRISDLAREAMRQSENRYRRLFETTRDGILLLNADSAQVEDVNPYLIEMLGYTHDEFLGKKLWELGPFADTANSKEMFVELQTNGYVRYENLPLKTKAGALLEVEFVSNSYDSEGITVIQCNIRDISDRVRAERALIVVQNKFQSVVVEQAIAGLYIVQDGKFCYVNGRGAQIMAQGSTSEVIGTQLLAWVVEADRGLVSENMRRILAGEAKVLPFDFGVRRRDGTEIKVGINAAMSTHEGRPAVIGLLQDISEKKHADKVIQDYIEELKSAFMSTVKMATIISEMRDPYTTGHERRVAKLAVAIGAEMGFDADGQEGLSVAGQLHDIGKIYIPLEILSKPGKLSAIEHQLIRQHSQASYDILKGVNFPWHIAEIALQHHERVDGSGYPQGLKGDAILLEARILAVADVIEAMSSHRPYRPALGVDKALAEIEAGRGTGFDPTVVDACLRLFREKSYSLPV